MKKRTLKVIDKTIMSVCEKSLKTRNTAVKMSITRQYQLSQI